ncbi:hypothetical protein KR009_000298 [Drosophila setifemur]|nr:hypothetical protein KR009_000298 [Drosophila setifemur]
MRLANEKAKMPHLPIDLGLLLGLTIFCLPSLTWAVAGGTLSDKRLCADPKCEQIISTGNAKISYMSGGDGLIPFKINAPIRILSKSAGSNRQLWGVEIGGRRGYANKDFIMEKKVIVGDKDLIYEMPVMGPARPSKEEPSAFLQPVQPVLNASELTDDVATTTTSPLDVKVDAIVMEQNKSGDQQAPDPTAASQAQVQLVDGTQLPLEAIPAVTESTVLPPNDTKSETASAAVDTKTPQETVSDDKPQPQEATKNSLKEQQPSELNDPQLSAIETQMPSQLPESINALLEDTDDFDYEEDEDEEIELKPDSKDNESLNEKQTDKKSINVSKPINPNLTVFEQTTDILERPNEEPKVEPAKEQNPNPEQGKQKNSANSDIFDLPTESPLQKDDSNKIPKILVESKPLKTAIVEEASKQILEEMPKGIVEEVRQQTVDEMSKKIVEQVTGTLQPTEVTEAPNPVEVTGAHQPTNVTGTSQPPGVTEAPQPTEAIGAPQPTVVTEAPKPTEVTGAPKPTEVTGAPQPVAHDVKENMSLLPEEFKAEPAIEKPENTADPVVGQPEANIAGQSESLPSSTVIPNDVAPVEAELVDLPLLFDKNNFENPNNYYKQLQEQQQQRVKIEAEQEQQKVDEAANSQSEEVVDNINTFYKQPQQIENQRQEDQHHYSTESVHQYPPSAENTTPLNESPYGAIYEEPTPSPETTSDYVGVGSVEPMALPAKSDPLTEAPVKEDGLGLFATIVDTVNNFIGKESLPALASSDELQRILYPAVGEVGSVQNHGEFNNYAAPANMDGYCARTSQPRDDQCHRSISLDNFAEVLTAKLIDHSLMLVCVLIAAVSSLFFIFAYYCFCNSSQEGALLSKLNHLERSLLASHKENLIIKHDLMTTRTKLASIEDNSFGSDDMVADLKKQLEKELYEKGKLSEQVVSLEKDLDNAAEAGLELNKMLSEVLSNQNGDEAFMSTVDELQRQLNDQEKIIIDINSSLAEKSRENSELQYSYTEATARLSSELKSLQEDNYELEMEKSKLQSRLEEIQTETEQKLSKALEARNYEMHRLQNQILEMTTKWEREHGDLQTSVAKIEALEDCLKALKKDANLNVHDLIASAKTRGELNATQKKFIKLQAKLEQEVAHKKRLESQLQLSSTDVEQLKHDFNQSERDKLEAQTRLEVLSGYFREKETELKKELSMQETKWLQHQGENASTVETQTLMKNEIQTLKSQNDELRAEIEAQIASHKAQMGTLENRAHESWLAARQSERRCEEALAEAAGLRRKLTTMANGGGVVDPAAMEAVAANGAPLLGAELKTATSPLPLPGSPLLNMPNLPFLPGPFSPFMGLPPPFLPPTAAGGARPPPLGRMRSPPPRDRDRDRYSDYSDYDDYDDDEEDDRGADRRRRHSGSWGRGHRDSYTHSPRTYRSLSPVDSRYNYNDTETEFSPPPSPPPATSGRSTGSRPYSEV